MARRAQTAAAVLGALSVAPMTGYELRRNITEVLGHFWHESFGQLYPCLTELLDESLVRAQPGDRTGSHRYRITAAGRRRLAELLAEPPTRQPPRDGLLLRVFFGRSLSPASVAEILDAEEASVRAALARYADIRAEVTTEDEYAAHRPYWLATLRAGELGAAARLAWIEETRAALDLPATLTPP